MDSSPQGAAGYETQRRSDIGPGTPDVLVLAEPSTGTTLHLITAQDPSGLRDLTPLRHAANYMASSKYEGLHHLAYEMRDPDHLITMLDHMAAHGARLHWGPGRHGPGHNVFTYHKDPDGNTPAVTRAVADVPAHVGGRSRGRQPLGADQRA